MFQFTKKRAVVMAVVGSLALSVGAYAYFTADGSGTGSATSGTSSAILISQFGSLAAPLSPGGAGQTVVIDVQNPGAGSQHVASVHLASITADETHPTCDVSSSTANPAFTMADVPVGTILAGQTRRVSGALRMNDTNADQNSCQGAVLTLNFTSN
jgi:hypothetical protein